MAVCTKCGAQMADDSRFCMQCGTPREEQPVMEPVVEASENEPVMEPAMEPAVETPAVENVMGQGFQFTAPAQSTYQGQIPAQPMFNAIPQEPRKKSKGPIIAILSAAVLAIVAIVIAIVMLLQPNVAEIDLSNYVEIEYEGYDTTGTAMVYINETKLLVDILKAQGEDATSTSKVSFSMKALINSIELETEYYENLTNGQKITITVKYDDLLREENEVEFKNATKEYEVEGLIELIEVDPFADVTIKYTGNSPDGYASCQNESDINCVRWADMEFDNREGLKNGDTVVLRITPESVEKAVAAGYKFTSTSKEYIVEGLSFYYESLGEISDEHMQQYREKADEILEESKSWTYDAEMTDIKLIGNYFAKSTIYASNNKIIFVYTATLTSTDGEFDARTIYIPVSMRVSCVEGGKLGDLYGSAEGYMWTEVGYSSYRGYVNGDVMYSQYILSDLPDDDYEVTASADMPEFKETTVENVLPAPTQTQEPTEKNEENETTTRPGFFGGN